MAEQAEATRTNGLYERDFYEWTQLQAKLLRERRFEDLDLENLIDEVSSVGGSDKRELESRLEVLIAHLLKWKYQPGARSAGWSGTINEQRRRLSRVLRDSPSLHRYPQDVYLDIYLSAGWPPRATPGSTSRSSPTSRRSAWNRLSTKPISPANLTCTSHSARVVSRPRPGASGSS